MDRRKTGDVLFYALQCAKDDRRAYADAVGEGTAEFKMAMADVKSFETLQIKLFGTRESRFEQVQKGMADVSVLDLRKLLKEQPEMFRHGNGCECEYCVPTLEGE